MPDTFKFQTNSKSVMVGFDTVFDIDVIAMYEEGEPEPYFELRISAYDNHNTSTVTSLQVNSLEIHHLEALSKAFAELAATK